MYVQTPCASYTGAKILHGGRRREWNWKGGIGRMGGQSAAGTLEEFLTITVLST